jgi:putative YhdH/YhfP family quinone oxidoreductase
MPVESFLCYLVRKLGDERIESAIEKVSLADLPEGDVLIRVEYSSLNYKDALAASGHPGVARKFPHVPGIDAAGTVVESRSSEYAPGQRVLVAGSDFGAGRWGGWGQYARVPADWVIPLPTGMSPRDAMIYGTAGFTAALSVDTLLKHGITADRGEVLVTGATGGVGILAVKLLALLGYDVAAVSGKADRYEWLKDHGAKSVISREEAVDTSSRPLLSARWAGVVDSVGGDMLATAIRASQIGGCVTACGLVGGAELPLTVYPFILRGVTLAGIDSAWCPRERRTELWNKLAGPWKPPKLDDVATTMPLEKIGEAVQQILQGKIAGRTVVAIPGGNT